MTLEEAKIVIEMRTKQFSKQAENEESWPIEKAFNDGVVDGLKIAMDAIEHVDAEPGVKDKLTLRELARELRKIFGFGYLVAYGSELHGYRVRAYLLKPNTYPSEGFGLMKPEAMMHCLIYLSVI